jgi:hypothetical protein
MPFYNGSYLGSDSDMHSVRLYEHNEPQVV